MIPEGRAFSLESKRLSDGATELQFAGSLKLQDAAALWSLLQQHVQDQPADTTLNFELAQVEAIDGAAMAMLVHSRAELHRKRVACELEGASAAVQELSLSSSFWA